MQYFKVLAEGGKSCHGGDADWRPGEWMPTIDNLEPCMRGYHLCEARDLVEWLGLEIWIAEARGEIIRSKNKTVVSGARIIQKLDNWTDRNARLFACDCAGQRPADLGETVSKRRPASAGNCHRPEVCRRPSHVKRTGCCQGCCLECCQGCCLGC